MHFNMLTRTEIETLVDNMSSAWPHLEKKAKELPLSIHRQPDYSYIRFSNCLPSDRDFELRLSFQVKTETFCFECALTPLLKGSLYIVGDHFSTFKHRDFSRRVRHYKATMFVEGLDLETAVVFLAHYTEIQRDRAFVYETCMAK